MLCRPAVAAFIVVCGLAFSTAAWAADSVFGVPRHSWDLALKLINFAILAYLIVKYGKAPLLNFLRGQREAVAGRFEALKSDLKQIEEMQADQDRLVAGLDARIAEIINYYKEVGEEEKRKILERAEATREFMLRDAEAFVNREFEESRKRFRAEVVDQAVALAIERIRITIDDQDQGRLVKDYLTKLPRLNALIH